MKSFFFYDLETSGLSARDDRIMQFAGQRTDMDLTPIGEPVNILVKSAEDTLPSPGAILVTKITPQKTQEEGMSEAEFCQFVEEEIFIPETCITGYNSVRFDDEFMRFTFWRNFHDAYAWQWKENRSRWDLLDVVRLTRALRPEGINWPVDEKGHATNRLELITKLNGIKHENAHDALADVNALIDVTRLIKEKQPKLLNYLYEMRDKRKVAKLVSLKEPRPFVYASGRYAAEFNKTTVAFPIALGRNKNLLVFDLRYNLEELLKLEKEQGGNDRKSKKGEVQKDLFFPVVKELCLNKCPAVAPIGVLDSEEGGKTGWEKIGLDSEIVKKNLEILMVHPEFADRMRDEYENRPEFPAPVDPESALYDGNFLDGQDSLNCEVIRNANENTLADFHPEFHDERLEDLLVHFKAKNYPRSLTEDESAKWEKYRMERLNRQLPLFSKEMANLQEKGETSRGQKADPFIVEELSLWYQNILPSEY